MSMRGILTLPADERVIAAALEGLTRVDMEYLRRFPDTPMLGTAALREGIRYAWEAPGMHWWSIPQVRAAGKGDCKDLSAWRAAELRMGGTPASVDVYRTGPRMFHAIVRTPWGTEDPSRALGMRAAAPPPPGIGAVCMDLPPIQVTALESLVEDEVDHRVAQVRARGQTLTRSKMRRLRQEAAAGVHNRVARAGLNAIDPDFAAADLADFLDATSR